MIRGLLRKCPEFDIVRVQDVNLSEKDDKTVLEWAAANSRVLVSHDVTTITDHACRRLLRGQPMPGVFEVVRGLAIGAIIENLILIDQCSIDGEWEGRISYLPLK